MANYKIKIEVFKPNKMCPKKLNAGDYFVVENMPGAEVPNGMCARAFHSIYPMTLGMRFSEETAWEKGKGYFDITCPDGIIYRLTRIK
jgi:uncharacterized repeat protein (TIGR04076 family)